MNISNFLGKFVQKVDGVTSIEYALLGALIAVVIVGAVQAVGLELGDLFEFVSDQVEAVNS